MFKKNKYSNLEDKTGKQQQDSKVVELIEPKDSNLDSYNPFLDLFNSNTGDITIKLQNKEELKLHTSILKQVPPFNKMFTHQFKETHDKIIDLSQYQTTGIKIFLKYLYLIKLPDNIADCMHIYHFCNIFCMDDKNIKENIMSNCNDETVCDILNVAEKYDVADIVDKCVEYLVAKVRKYSAPCFDAIEPGGVGIGSFKDSKYTVAHCCYHYQHQRHTYSSKYNLELATTIAMHDALTKKNCIYYTLTSTAFPTNKNEYQVNMCCEHRDKYKTDFIEKISPEMKDRILKKLVAVY